MLKLQEIPRVAPYVLAVVAAVGIVATLLTPGPAQDPPAPPTQPTPGRQPPTARAEPPPVAEPLDLVPAESLLCWYGRPFPDTQAGSGEPSALWTVLQLGPRLVGTALDPQSKLYARGIEAFGLAIRYPHAFVLIDTQAKPVASDPRVPRVDRLRFAAIVQAEEQAEAFVRVIQAAVNEQTDTQKATLTRRQAGPWSYQELRDSRLPEWCVIAWGRMGAHFVLTVGPDVWATVAAVAAGQAPALSRADWLASVRGERGRKALVEIIVAAQDIRQRLDPFVDGRATDFFRAWHAENLERAHWALGFEGPALYCVAHFMEGGTVRERIYADPQTREPYLLATIPDTARYAIYRIIPTRVIPSLVGGYLATQGRDMQRRAADLWNAIQADAGFDAQRDILAQLGEYVVMHNDPPHPLHIPLAMTILAEIRGEPQRVRESLEKACRGWQAAWDRQAADRGAPNTARLERDSAGIWYLKYGPVAGPAWIVTDRFVVVSWSQWALRSYLEKVGDRAGEYEK